MTRFLLALALIALGSPALAATVTNVGPQTLNALDISSVTTGGTAVTAIAAGKRTSGGWIQNPPSATFYLCINEAGTASGIVSTGTTFCIAPGQTYILSPSIAPVSVISADSTHPFAGLGMQ